MEIVIVILLGLVGGWGINLLADTLPEKRPLLPAWNWPFLQLGMPLHRAGAQPPHLPSDLSANWVRVWVTWGGALLLALLAYGSRGISPAGAATLLYAWFFLAVAVIDLEHRRVLNRMLLVALPVMLVFSLTLQQPAPSSALLGAAAGFGFFLAVAVVRPGGMGMGDVKLAGIIGLATGLSGVAIALTIGIVAGGIAAIVVLVRQRFDRRATMAYAPYLVFGAWVALFLGARVWPY